MKKSPQYSIAQTVLALSAALMLVAAFGCQNSLSRGVLSDQNGSGAKLRFTQLRHRLQSGRREQPVLHLQTQRLQWSPTDTDPRNSQTHFRDPLPAEFAIAPLTSADDLPEQVELEIDDLLQIALTDTTVLRSLGGQVLVNPANVGGTLNPAINSTDPIFGVEAALAQFDANLTAGINHANNDDVFNNSILGGGATEVVQDLVTANTTLRKVAATGTQFSLQKNLIYDNNNNPTSTFPSSYATFWQAQARQPLLQGRGLDFNRIAGPNAQPGFRNTNGVVISQLNHDTSIVKFEQDVREYVNEVVTAYWELYFSYENFATAKQARDSAHTTWQTVKAKFDNDLAGGEADKEAQAREQYFQFQQQLVTALNGDPRVQVTGVLQAESNLRRLLGLPQSDRVLIRPAGDPIAAKTVFDWSVLVSQTLNSRVELKQQSYQIKKRELELLASKNFLLPRLDAVATVRNNGFGDDLTGGSGRFSSALNDSVSGDHNEWELGMQMSAPIGFRQAAAGVRNYELRLLQERAVLAEQEKQIIHDLGTAIRQTEQYHASMELAYNRMLAARDMNLAREAAYAADAVSLDLLLESQRRLATAETEFSRAQINYQLAHERVNRESGRLLIDHAIVLNSNR